VSAGGGSVSLSATDQTGLDVDVLGISVSAGGAGAVSINLAGAVVVATTDVAGTVRALIDDSDVDASGDVIVAALGNSVVDIDGDGVALSAGGAGGSIAILLRPRR